MGAQYVLKREHYQFVNVFDLSRLIGAQNLHIVGIGYRMIDLYGPAYDSVKLQILELAGD